MKQMPQRLQQWDRSPIDTIAEVGPIVVIGAFASIMDHFWGVVDVLAILVGMAWALYMLSGATVSVLREWVDSGWKEAHSALDDQKAAEGLARGVGVGFAVILLGFVEILQETLGGAYVPLVAPMLVFAFGWFALKTGHHITQLHDSLGTWIQRTLRKRLPISTEEDEESKGD